MGSVTETRIFYYNADLICDKCAELVKQELLEEYGEQWCAEAEEIGDSEGWPIEFFGENLTESPNHCGGRETCPERIECLDIFDRPFYVGQVLPGVLTAEGEAELIRRYKNGVINGEESDIELGPCEACNTLAELQADAYNVSLPEDCVECGGCHMYGECPLDDEDAEESEDD